ACVGENGASALAPTKFRFGQPLVGDLAKKDGKLVARWMCAHIEPAIGRADVLLDVQRCLVLDRLSRFFREFLERRAWYQVTERSAGQISRSRLRIDIEGFPCDAIEEPHTQVSVDGDETVANFLECFRQLRARFALALEGRDPLHGDRDGVRDRRGPVDIAIMKWNRPL